MTVEELIQKLVELAKEGKGQYQVMMEGDMTYRASYLEHNDKLKQVVIV